ncbi:unnamed protein product [Mycena citricolor]|uniref:Uncharacterized protein n=1 Tax=Mycena citricolor TaxID=2018698 RepID=A0AAD2Q0T0_9AGAR|nr:unnamed protein product [Mycena citricolor]
MLLQFCKSLRVGQALNDLNHPECDSASGPLPLELVTMGDDELSGTSTMTAVPRNPMSLG